LHWVLAASRRLKVLGFSSQSGLTLQSHVPRHRTVFLCILCFGMTYCLHAGREWRDDDVRRCTHDVRKITPFQYIYIFLKLIMCFFVKLLFTSKATPYLNSADQNEDLINFTYYVLQCSTRNYVWHHKFVGEEYDSTVIIFCKKKSLAFERTLTTFQHPYETSPHFAQYFFT